MSDNVFHDHLDTCKQCREHPFALCRVGADALKQAAQDLAAGRLQSSPQKKP